MSENIYTKYYGESNTMKLTVENGDIIFKSRYQINFLVFITLLFIMLLPSLIFEYYPHINFVIAYFISSTLISVTYRRMMIFKKAENKMIYYRSVLGLKLSKAVDFQDIKSILISTVNKPIIGVQVPIPVKKYSIDIILNSGVRIHLDRSTDFQVIKKYAEALSIMTSVKPVRK